MQTKQVAANLLGRIAFVFLGAILLAVAGYGQNPNGALR
jgi:hypothetical protein